MQKDLRKLDANNLSKFLNENHWLKLSTKIWYQNRGKTLTLKCGILFNKLMRVWKSSVCLAEWRESRRQAFSICPWSTNRNIWSDKSIEIIKTSKLNLLNTKTPINNHFNILYIPYFTRVLKSVIQSFCIKSWKIKSRMPNCYHIFI